MKLAARDVMTEAFTKPYMRGLERMALSFGTTAPDGTTFVKGYDFHAYQTLYGRLPDAPSYLVVPWFSPSADLDVTFQFSQGAPVTISLLAKTKPGLSIAIPLPPLVDPHLSVNPSLRLTQFKPGPDPPTGQPADNWSIFVVIGNIAKLLWVLGGEMDLLSWHLDDISAQRQTLTAHTLSLDYLGEDLGVPRFPPTAYAWDPVTIALYHLDDVPPASGTFTVADARDIHASGSGHSGTGHNVAAGQAGRFRQAFRFASATGGSYVSVVGSAALGGDLATVGDIASDLTIEAFIHPDPPAAQPGCVLAKKAQLTGTGAGWAITVGTYRSVVGNVRFSIADGAQYFELFADMSVADGRYHHVAGVVQRRTGFSLLYLVVDGRQVMRLLALGLGAVTNGQDMQIGLGTEVVAGDAQYLGLIDEVRVSRVARESFDPVLNGEGDEAYRQRLGIFKRWTLPSPTSIEAAVNELVQVGTPPDPSSFKVYEEPNSLVIGSQLLRVLPKELKPEQSIAADGRLGAAEADVVGVAGDTDFDSAWLVTYSDARISDGGHSTWSLMQASVRDALAALVSKVGAPLNILAGYETGGTGLYAEGRALLLQHGTVEPGALSASAHIAGFDYVRREASGGTYVAQARREVFRIGAVPSAAPVLTDVGEGDSLALSLSPEPPRDCEVRWSLTCCGPGAAHFEGDDPHNAAGDPNLKGGQTLHADAAGDIALQVEVTRTEPDGAVGTGRGSRVIRIGIDDSALVTGHSISRDGARDQPEAIASPASTFFDETYLVTRDEDLTSSAVLIDYGSDPLHRRMQRATSELLTRLLLKVPRATGGLKVLGAFDPGATAGIGQQQGRALLLSHSLLSPSALAARAFSVGFDFVAVQGSAGSEAVYVSVAPAELLAVSALARPIVVDDAVHSIELTVEPQARPSNGCFLPDGGKAYVAETGSHRVTELTVMGAQNTFPTFTVNRSAWVGIGPTSVCATASSVFVANQLSNTISILDPSTTGPLSVASTVTTDPSPVCVVTDGTAIFVACSGSVGGNSTVKRYPIGSTSSSAVWNVPTGRQPLALVVSGGQLFVTHAPTGGPGAGAFDVLNATSLAHVTSVATGLAPVSALVRTNRLFIGCRDAIPAMVQVFDISNALSIPAPVVVTLPPSVRPLSLALSGDASQKYVYVAVGPAISTAGAGRVHIIDVTAAPLLLSQYVSIGADPSFVMATPGGTVGSPPFYNPALAIVSQDACNIAIADPAALGVGEPPEVAAVVPIGTGAGERLQWAIDSLGPGRANLTSMTRPHVSIPTEGRQPGWISMRAIMAMTDKLDPYSFELRLKPTLEVSTTRIEKNQYDIIMNVLNSFHPIGVEVRTGRLRQYVPELGEGLTDLLPGYTFPIFRTPRLPQLPTGSA